MASDDQEWVEVLSLYRMSPSELLVAIAETRHAAHEAGAREMRERVRHALRGCGEGVVALHELRRYVDEATEPAQEGEE